MPPFVVPQSFRPKPTCCCAPFCCTAVLVATADGRARWHCIRSMPGIPQAGLCCSRRSIRQGRWQGRHRQRQGRFEVAASPSKVRQQPLGTSQGEVTACPQQAALGAAAPTPEVQPAKAERRQLPQLHRDQQHLHNRLQSQPSPVPQQQPQQSPPDGGNDGHSGPDGDSGPGEHQRRWPTTGARHSGGADTKGTVDIQPRCPPTAAARPTPPGGQLAMTRRTLNPNRRRQRSV